MWSTLRERGVSYLIVGPFAIVLAFPFYWMLVTAFKTNGDLYNLDNVPFTYHPSQAAVGEKLSFQHDHWLPFGFENATTSHITFIFSDTNYLRWVENTAVVGGLVVVITLLLAVPAGYSLARLSGRWGQSVGVGIFLTYLVPPTLLFLPLSRVISKLGLQDRLWSLVLVYPSFTIPFATWLLMGFFKTIPRERVRLRDHVHLGNEAAHDLGRRADGSDPRRRLLLAVADGRNVDPEHPARAALQQLSQPFHRRLYGRCVSLTWRTKGRRETWPRTMTSSKS